MKKVLSLILAAAMLVSLSALAGCGNNSNGASSNEAASSAKKSDNVLTMATNASFPPYEYHEGTEIVGIDAEIAKAIAEDIGMKLEIVDIDFDSIITGVQTGKYDMGMAGMTKTEEREQSVSFSSSYATATQVIIVPEDSPIKTSDDLFADGAKYKAGVQLSTTGDIYATDDLGADRVTQYQTGADAVAALKAGKVDCVIIDNEPAKSYVKANDGLKILDTEYVTEEYAICFAKDNTELLEKVNASLEKLIADGTVQKIIDKYITAD